MGDKMVEPGLEPIVNDCGLNYEAEYKELRKVAEELKLENEELRRQKQRFDDWREIDRLRGIVEGLRFAVRCNGISGGDVQ